MAQTPELRKKRVKIKMHNIFRISQCMPKDSTFEEPLSNILKHPFNSPQMIISWVMQAHFTKAIASLTYLLKMQSRAHGPAHLQTDRSVLRWSGVLCWVGVSCCVKAVAEEGLDHAGAHNNACLLEESPEYYNILQWKPVARQALVNRGKASLLL